MDIRRVVALTGTTAAIVAVLAAAWAFAVRDAVFVSLGGSAAPYSAAEG